METLVFGGSFNPPTVAHQAIITACLKRPQTQEVWVMPSGERADKRHALDDTDRLNMLHAMHHEVFNTDRRIVISWFELDYMTRPTQTWRTVKALAEYYADKDFRFIFGADAYQNMPTWDHGDRLRKELKIAVVPRSGYDLAAVSSVEILPLEIDQNTSSTEVRRMRAAGLPIGHLVCQSIANYIEEGGLYRP